MRLLALFLALTPSLVAADTIPKAARDDPRFASVAYMPNQPVRVAMTPGSSLTVLFNPGEQIGDVRVNNYARFQVTVSQARDSLVLRMTAVTSANGTSSDGTMLVSSSAHTYSFIVTTAPPGQIGPYVLRFTGGKRSARGRRSASVANPQYRIWGNREVRPSSISDDGAKTFIQWPADAAIPAVFALEHGREEMVNGFVRGGIFTIDRVHERLVFRIDKLQAEAVRQSKASS